MTDQRERLDINWVQVCASALAAVSSAVLLSTVGVAGTIIGAAIGSLFATAGSSVYSHYLRVTRERVTSAQVAALERVGRARVSVSGAAVDVRGARGGTRTQARRAEREVEQADQELDHAERDLQDAEEGVQKPPWREIFTGLPWRRIAVVAAGIFVIAMLVIVTFELVTGRPVSSYTGGTTTHARTSIPGLGTTRASKTPAPTHSASPSSAPTTAAPTATPTTTPSPSAAAVTPTPSATPSPSAVSTPTSSPTVVPTPTQAQTPAG